MHFARGWAGLGVVLILGSALAGCSGSSGTGNRATAAPSAAANAGLGAAPTSVTPSANVTKKVTEANFRTPSKNIGCYLSADSARCDIVKKSWAPPAKPANCELDWGNGVSVDQDGAATFTCAGDTMLGAREELAYGQSLQAGDFVCDSSRAAMRCSNVTSGHGFTLSVQQYDLF
jgi:hypothetical protein